MKISLGLFKPKQRRSLVDLRRKLTKLPGSLGELRRKLPKLPGSLYGLRRYLARSGAVCMNCGAIWLSIAGCCYALTASFRGQAFRGHD